MSMTNMTMGIHAFEVLKTALTQYKQPNNSERNIELNDITFQA